MLACHETGGRHGSDWKLGFIAFFLLPKGGGASLVQTDVSWEGEVSPWLIITFGNTWTSCRLPFNLATHLYPS
jgi:hypothetical protein